MSPSYALGIDLNQDQIRWVLIQKRNKQLKLMAYGTDPEHAVESSFGKYLKWVSTVYAHVSPSKLYFNKVHVHGKKTLHAIKEILQCSHHVAITKNNDDSYLYACLLEKKDKDAHYVTYSNHEKLTKNIKILSLIEQNKIQIYPFSILNGVSNMFDVSNQNRDVVIIQNSHGFDIYVLYHYSVECCQSVLFRAGQDYTLILKDLMKTYQFKPGINRILCVADEDIKKRIESDFPGYSVQTFSNTGDLCQDVQGLPERKEDFCRTYYLALCSAFSSMNDNLNKPMFIRSRALLNMLPLRRQLRTCGVLLLCFVWIFAAKSMREKFYNHKKLTNHQRDIEFVAHQILGEKMPLIDPVQQVRQYVLQHKNSLYINMDEVMALLNTIKPVDGQNMIIKEMHIVENNGVILKGIEDNELTLNNWVRTIKLNSSYQVAVNNTKPIENGLEFELSVSIKKEFDK
ncbi:MAG: hypothetical protein Q8Q33_05740 [Chlamydiota bacterium]|nr:hypothetical protein [Chlamydiota bacterium]